MNCDFCSNNNNVKSYPKYHRHYGVKRGQHTVYKANADATKVTTYNILGEFTPNLCPKCYKKYLRRNILSNMLTGFLTIILLVMFVGITSNFFDLSVTFLGTTAAVGFLSYVMIYYFIRTAGEKILGGGMDIIDQYEHSILKPRHNVKAFSFFTDAQYSTMK